MLLRMRLVPLVTLALELAQPVAVLAGRLGPRTTVDPESGLQVVDVATCRELIAQRDAQLQREAEQRARRATQPNPLLERVVALAAQQHRMRQEGLLDNDTPAVAVMAGADHQARMEVSGYNFDAMIADERQGVIGSGYTFPTANQE